MAYAEIVGITAPSSAAPGQSVNIEVRIKNTYSTAIMMMVGGALEYGVTPWPQIDYPNRQASVGPWLTHTFYGSFIMPNNIVTIHAYSYYKGTDGYWHFDDEKTAVVTLEVEKWVKLATAEISIGVTSPPPPEKWVKLATAELSIGVLLPKEWVKLATAELDINPLLHKGQIVVKQLDVENEWRSIPQDVLPDTETRVKVITRNTGTTTYRPTCVYEVTGSDGELVERYEHTASVFDKAGPGEETSFYPVFDTFFLRDEGDYNLEIWLSAHETGGELDHWSGKLCTVKEGVVPPPPTCTPGETKCIGFDLYECNPSGDEWVLIEENSPQCAAEEEGFPWLILVGGLGLAAVALIVSGEKKPTKAKKS